MTNKLRKYSWGPSGKWRRVVCSGTFLRSFNAVAYAGGMSRFPWKRTVVALLVFGTALAT
jgi:hypothetical protein